MTIKKLAMLSVGLVVACGDQSVNQPQTPAEESTPVATTIPEPNAADPMLHFKCVGSTEDGPEGKPASSEKQISIDLEAQTMEVDGQLVKSDQTAFSSSSVVGNITYDISPLPDMRLLMYQSYEISREDLTYVNQVTYNNTAKRLIYVGKCEPFEKAPTKKAF